MDLPLQDVYAAQERQGRLVRVNADGSLWSAPEPEPEPEVGEDEPVGPHKPARVDNKAAWVTYAELVSDMGHDELEAMTKADLVKRFG